MKFKKILQKLKTYSDHHQHQMSCVIADKGKIISMGFNSMKTSPRSPHPYHSLHAEVSALLGNSLEDLKGCTAYIYRETRDGRPANAKPCPYCMQALQLAGIKKICYSIEDGYIQERI